MGENEALRFGVSVSIVRSFIIIFELFIKGINYVCTHSNRSCEKFEEKKRCRIE